MNFDPVTVMQSRRDSCLERDLKQWLRTLPEGHRFEFVSQCLDIPGYSRECRALIFATSCISNRAHVLAILRRGLACADASSIQFWLKFAIPKLGGRRVVKEVARLVDSNPDAVSKAIYWLPKYLPESQRKARSLFVEFHAEARKRGIIKGPITTPTADGRTLFSNVYPPAGSELPEGREVP